MGERVIVFSQSGDHFVVVPRDHRDAAARLFKLSRTTLFILIFFLHIFQPILIEIFT